MRGKTQETPVSKQLDIPFVIVDNVNPSPELIGKFPREHLLKNRILPLYELEEEIAVACDDPLKKEAFDIMESLTGKKVRISSANGEKIEELLITFFSKEAVPTLVNSISSLLKRIEGTSFYRIDFAAGECCCDISVFGCGIMKEVERLGITARREEILGAFKLIGIPVIYDYYTNEIMSFLSVYPLENVKECAGYPAIVGELGLVLPDGIFFADLPAHGTATCFQATSPVEGYPYLTTKKKAFDAGNLIFTLDSAPSEFQKYYVRMAIPEKCGQCKGSGCAECRELGYTFSKRAEGFYSSVELRALIDGGAKCQR